MDRLRPSLMSAWHTLQDRVRQLRRNRRDHLVHHVGLAYLLVVPVLLAVATALVLFVHSDVNVAMLFSQCHARARLPGLSRIPLLGTPSCFLVSFFQEALARSSTRAFASMSAVLSFIGSLLTVSTVEAARICNGPSVLIAYPTGPWLVFNLVGGAMVWELLITPAFFRRSKEMLRAHDAGHDAGHDGDGDSAANPNTGRDKRHLAVVSEVVAIPVAVALGFVVPSLAMLVTDHPVAIAVWLFFPVYVSLIRQGVRFVIQSAGQHRPGRTLHLESHTPALLAVYAVPLLCSVLSHGLVLWLLVTGRPDDRQEMTRSTLRFIEIDVVFIVLTVLYWILVEAGWRVVAVVLGASVVLGPGAGLCIGWIYREHQLGFVDDDDHHSVEGDGGGGHDGAGAAGEQTPLLR
ncbi:hypothetical protein SPBR_02908 [Sporothrix brasiliensis 5110]|uniref:Corticosteroid-binding protein n=1 Tax=Sporothrix brasiliensis 5110 TaxID=1398154 RepID=A0A0C2ITG1_9PEZI|nr:uncharacterized protein SPBR_02908 [Sporothrix brasiliensis 5110]KIH92371.1 hypothetical protein SPBR_02908 [Sporothrix brasiliensis 5110]